MSDLSPLLSEISFPFLPLSPFQPAPPQTPSLPIPHCIKKNGRVRREVAREGRGEERREMRRFKKGRGGPGRRLLV